MALQIEKATREGYTVSYWRLSPVVSYDVVNQRLTANILPYVNSTMRQNGKPSVNFEPSAASMDDFDEVRRVVLEGAAADAAVKTGEPRDALYAAVKTKNFFSGASDV